MIRIRLIRNLATIAFGLTVALIVLLPIGWGLIISLKSRADALTMPPLWRFSPTFVNYRTALVEGRYAGCIVNSLIIAGSSTFIAMCLGVPASYALSRRRFCGQSNALLGIFTVRMAPATVIALPLFLIFSRLRLIDSFVSIVVVHAAVSLALCVWLMKGFFDEIPQTIDEASLLDGDGHFGVMIKQVLPSALPGLLVTGAFCFINSWNEFFLALMLTGYDTQPFTVAVPALVTPHGTNWGQIAAVTTVGLLPGLFFAILARRYLVRELTAGAVWEK